MHGVLLVAENLTVERGARTILRTFSFMAKGGEAVVLTGPNGSGKTTLLRTLAGFLRPASGWITLQGGDGDHLVGEQAHFIGHANAIKANLTVRENATFWARYLKSGNAPGTPPVEELAAAALEHFAILDLSDFPAAYLSAGQRRRLGLVRLLVAHRPLWLLDEPTVSLDAASTRLLGAAVNAHLKSGGIVVAATHLPLGFDNTREISLGAVGGGAVA